MPSSSEYLAYVLDLLSDLEDVSERKMMGEYVLYYRGRVFGGVYDDRFLIKPTKSVLANWPSAPRELNYEGGSHLVLVDSEDRDEIAEIVRQMWSELPPAKVKKRR